MNEQYKAVSTTANILQSIFDVMKMLGNNGVELPTDDNELMSDIQATVARKIGKVV